MNNLFKYPLEEKPPTWPINDTFIRALDHAREIWRTLGYHWKFGIEVELIPLLEHEFPKGDETLARNPQTAPFFRLRDAFRAKAIDPVFQAAQAYRKIRKIIETDDSLVQELSRHSLIKGREEILYELEQYEARLSSNSESVVSSGVVNAFLAHLHVFSPKENGLRGLIQPRFGDYTHGKGWWDDKGVAEIRTEITEDPFFLIKKYHWIVERIMAAGESFGVIPSTKPFSRQIHFSLWKDGRNIMRMERGTDKNLCEKMMHGIVQGSFTNPYLVKDTDPTDMLKVVNAEATSSKNRFIRQNSDSWEYRPPYTNTWPHIARDLAMLIGGAGIYFFRRIPLARLTYVGADSYVVRVDSPIVQKTNSLDDHGLAYILNQCAIGKDGKSIGLPDVIRSGIFESWTHSLSELLVKVAKEKNLLADGLSKLKFSASLNYECSVLIRDMFDKSVTDTDKNMEESFTRLFAWVKIFDILKVNPQNELEVDPEWEHPDLRIILDGLKVSGRRIHFEVSGFKVPSGSSTLRSLLDEEDTSRHLKYFFDSADANRVVKFYKEKLLADAQDEARKIARHIADDILSDMDDDLPTSVKKAVLSRLVMPLIELNKRAEFYADNPVAAYRVYEPMVIEELQKMIDEERQSKEQKNMRLSALSEAHDFLRDNVYDYSHYIDLFVDLAFKPLKSAPLHRMLAQIEALGPLADFMRSVHLVVMPKVDSTTREKDVHYLTWSQEVLDRSKERTEQAITRNLERYIKLYGEDARKILEEHADYVRSEMFKAIDIEEFGIGDMEYCYMREQWSICPPITRYAREQAEKSPSP